MDPSQTQTMFWVALVAVVVILILFTPHTREGMEYLDQYERQDNFHNVFPRQWPVVHTPVTAGYEVRRYYIEKEKAKMEACGCGPQGMC